MPVLPQSRYYRGLVGRLVTIGRQGHISIVTKFDHVDCELTAEFGPSEAVFDFGELDALQLAYATMIHKSQGSEYPVVVLPLTMQACTMLGRELIYVAVTRA